MTVAKYIRLSDADDGAGESDSVANQRALLDRFLRERPEFRGAEVLEFVDDGRSGTNFERPGFRAMLELAQRGGIGCIAVKDLSRLGRSYIEAGEYLERVFPALGVRFLSVNDGYDSAARRYGSAGDLDLGFRNLVSELYSRDLSQRVKTARRQYAERADCIEAPFFGYRKSPEDRRRLLVDPPAAETVRLIFRLALEGLRPGEIARRLEALGRASPSRRKGELGMGTGAWGREPPGWTREAVRRVLRDERYTGKKLSLRRERVELGSPRQRAVPREDWVAVEGAFEAIVPEGLFRLAQALLPPREKGP